MGKYCSSFTVDVPVLSFTVRKCCSSFTVDFPVLSFTVGKYCSNFTVDFPILSFTEETISANVHAQVYMVDHMCVGARALDNIGTAVCVHA